MDGWFTVTVNGEPKDVWGNEPDALAWARFLANYRGTKAEVRPYNPDTDAMVARYSPQLNQA